MGFKAACIYIEFLEICKSPSGFLWLAFIRFAIPRKLCWKMIGGKQAMRSNNQVAVVVIQDITTCRHSIPFGF